jgi:hypothetical protein
MSPFNMRMEAIGTVANRRPVTAYRTAQTSAWRIIGASWQPKCAGDAAGLSWAEALQSDDNFTHRRAHPMRPRIRLPLLHYHM